VDAFSLLFIYLSVLIAFAAGISGAILRSRSRREGLVSRSLNLELIAVRFPPPTPQEEQQSGNIQQIREKIALMEQFYTHLFLIRDTPWREFWYGKPVFSLEITVPSVGEETSFFIAVPRRLVKAVEKIIQGIFPDAHVEESRDYNIFNPEGASAASVVLLSRNRYYPIRSYQKLEGDPMKEMTNVFTKLAKEGEGAALQVIARPAPGRWAYKLKNNARKIFEGKRIAETGLQKTVKIIEEITKSPSRDDQSFQANQKRITPLQEEIVKSLEAKAGKPLFETNIRLVSSAATRPRAEEILRGLEFAFAQFLDQNLNGFTVVGPGEKGLKDLFFNFSFRNFREKDLMVLGGDELTSVFHFPNVPIETPKIKGVKAREAPPPNDLPGEGVLLGYSMFRGDTQDIKLTDEDRRRHLYIIGQTGTGKTTLMKNMIVQDIEEGRGVCFIDPHGDTVEDILGFVPRQRIQDVIYFNPGDIERPLGLNMLEYDPTFPEQKTFLVNEMLSIFEKLYGSVPEALGPIFQQYFRNSTMLVMDDPSSGNTLLEISRVMSEKSFRDLKISRAKNVVVRAFWTEIAEKAGSDAELKNVVPYITSKFDNFTSNDIMRPIIAQEKSAFNFRDVMDGGKILLVNLSKGRLGDINSSLLGLIIVGRILMASLSRIDISDESRRRDFYLYIDEFQNVTTDSIATILSEARKYRLDLIVAHQFIGQLKEEIKKAIFGNVGSLASFRIGSDDTEFLAKQFKPVFDERDLLNIDNYNCYVKLLIRGQTSPGFNMKVYPPKKGDRVIADTIKEISRLAYGRPREEVEEEIRKKYEKPIF
jgi:hypothetical protein